MINLSETQGRSSSKDGITVTSLGSGSRGNCLYVGTPVGALLIDAGFSAKETLRRLALADLDPAGISAILLTHEHGDHIRGLGPLSRRLGIPAYLNEATYRSIGSPSLPEVIHFKTGDHFQVGALRVETLALPHDAVDPAAFIVEWGGRRVGNFTDFGIPTNTLIDAAKGCDVLVLEANHDEQLLMEGSYPWPVKQRILSRWGHLSNSQSLSMVEDLLTPTLKGMVLAHISQKNNRAELAFGLVKGRLQALGAGDIPLFAASQGAPLEPLFMPSI